MKKLSYLIALPLLALAACSNSNPQADSSIQVQDGNAIVGGRYVLSKDPLVKKVVLLEIATNSGKGNCTGTPIGKRVILTAAHCAEDVISIKAIFSNGAKPREGQPVTIEAVSWVHDEEFAGAGSRGDVAVVNLTEDIPEDYKVSKIYDGVSELSSKKITLIGYGVTTEMDLKKTPRLRKTFKEFGVDAELDVERSMLMITQPHNGICYGDSGGPVFVEVNNELQIYGVNSYGEGSMLNQCHNIAGAAYVPDYLKWIKEHTDLEL